MLHFRSLGETEKSGQAPPQAGAAPVAAISEISSISSPGTSTSGKHDVDPSRPLDVDVFTPVPGKVPMTPNKLALSPTPIEPMSKQDGSIVEELGLKTSDRPAGKPKPMATLPPDPRTARPPQPTKEEGSSAWMLVLGLLLLAGGVVAFLVFGT